MMYVPDVPDCNSKIRVCIGREILRGFVDRGALHISTEHRGRRIPNRYSIDDMADQLPSVEEAIGFQPRSVLYAYAWFVLLRVPASGRQRSAVNCFISNTRTMTDAHVTASCKISKEMKAQRYNSVIVGFVIALTFSVPEFLCLMLFHKSGKTLERMSEGERGPVWIKLK